MEVTQQSDFFLSDLLKGLGFFTDKVEFSAISYAECVDLMAYTSMINFTEYASGQLSVFEGIGGFYVSVKDLIENIMGLFE